MKTHRTVLLIPLYSFIFLLAFGSVVGVASVFLISSCGKDENGNTVCTENQMVQVYYLGYVYWIFIIFVSYAQVFIVSLMACMWYFG